MKYSTEITIELPRTRVIELFEDPDNLVHWLDGLESYKHISGERLQPGAVSEFVFKQGKGPTKITETVKTRNIPDEFSGVFTTDGMWNFCANHLSETAQGHTIWRQENEFRGEGFMLKLVMFLAPWMFKNQSRKQMEQFKAFAEGL